MKIKLTDIITIHNLQDPFASENIFHDFNRNVLKNGRPYNDTFNILNKYQVINYADLSNELPKSVCTDTINDSFEQLVDARICELTNKYPHITLLYSGGYDSCTIASAFIRNNIPKSKYSLLFGDGSIEESPKFFEFLCKQKVHMIRLGDSCLYDYLDQCTTSTHYIVGLPETQFGYSKMFLPTKEFWFDNWQDGLVKAFQKFNLQHTNYSDLIDIFDEYLAELQLTGKVTCLLDLLYVYIYSALYTHTTCHVASELKASTYFKYHNTLFYRTPQFARFAFTHYLHHDPAIVYRDDWIVQCKQVERDYILSLFNDPEIENKKKVHSQRREAEKHWNGLITVETKYGSNKINPKQHKQLLIEAIHK